MTLSKYFFIIISAGIITSCGTTRKTESVKTVKENNATASTSTRKKTFVEPLNVDRKEFVDFAKTLLGTPYKYASAIPSKGLDCSGFIYYVFNHFNIKAPRSSVDFTNEGRTIDIKKALPGDIILFTGSDHSTGIVGHMGIVTENGKELKFIHSASGKSVGVTINVFTGYYKTHFVKVIRILA